MSCAAALQLEAARHPTPPPLKEALAPRLPASLGTPGISGPSGGAKPCDTSHLACSHQNKHFAAGLGVFLVAPTLLSALCLGGFHRLNEGLSKRRFYLRFTFIKSL